MPLSHTHDVPGDDGKSRQVAQCTCDSCKNIFWVTAAHEHEPTFCPYCGIKFVGYDDGNGNVYGMSGLPK